MFGDRLKELREEKQLTQEELGKFLNVSRQTISGYEAGAIEPSISNLVKLANIFNVSLDYLLCRTKERYNLNLKDKKNKELLLDLIKVIDKHK
ncbi:TPA: helix-turn-helix domain-containing protein [Clostridium botulinum]|uniref:helix-turn-helix domain-containing protein n=1 Tax=Clostridium botulinum TaxID=1491 RepID=UPI0007730473|nr:helix-turn-helix transcriptional regulator [Clostridium botulinum]MBN3360155.1 XRE family transcriptional regulator [Clostridium botulinum]NFM82633.1 helix-turn-helix transcriptional regulator [Clostridium botulinum]NFP12259.1 helix-turn-helix transcriptional regulator [Clostridium botulinum]NFR29719.1 helix-turn-helix transcriptional regulator [Clostridium botulinum]NFU55712.1 helix-turn-helix transcriptional regulator [Clostridium botulinum]